MTGVVHAAVTAIHNPAVAAASLAARPGSREARMRLPLAGDALRVLAERNGVCVNPVAVRRVDTVTGRVEYVDVRCDARLASKCKPCAQRNRRLRQVQIREGWHLSEEPVARVPAPGEDVLGLVAYRAHLEFELRYCEDNSLHAQADEVREEIARTDGELAVNRLRGTLTRTNRPGPARRVRSTRRRQDSPELPRLPVAPRTVGKVYVGRDGKAHRPSMLISPTLPSYGSVHTAARFRRGELKPCECGALHGEQDPLLGVPLDLTCYDYRRAARDAVFFPKLLDRLWQNTRRCVAWNVQYAGCVEMQKRLAPHAHFTVRGTIPRRDLRRIAAATYHQVWWPQFDTPVFSVAEPPIWDADRAAYVHPRTGEALRTWAEALDAIDADPHAQPAYVARLGSIDARGITAGTADADRAIRYVTKYLTKDITAHVNPRSDAQREHFDRLHMELSTVPCSPTCANWLLYGVAPDKAKAGLVPGRCTGKVHQRRSLGFTGRRVLMSRQWSKRTLVDVKADQSAWVRAILSGRLDTEGTDGPSDEPDPANGPQRYSFSIAKPHDPGVRPREQRILRAIAAAIRGRNEIAHARGRPPTRELPAGAVTVSGPRAA